MRILQLVTDDDRRGAQVFGVSLHAELAARGHTVRTVALASGREGGLDLPILGPRRVSPQTLAAAYGHARQADVMVGHGSTCLLVGSMVRTAAGRRGPKFVYRQISDPLAWAPTVSRRLRVTACYRTVDRVAALARQPATTLQERFGVPADRISIIPNGVPADTFQPVDVTTRHAHQRRLGITGHPAMVVAYVGALDAGKGVDVIIRAVLERPHLHLLVAGTGAEREPLEAMAGPASDRITFLGQLPDVAPVLAAADVLALASRTESMPAVLIEAGLAGLPVVATRVGAVAEIVVDEATGLLVPPGTPSAVGAALDRLAGDELLRLRFGSAARRRCIEGFELGAVSTRWEDLLVELVTGQPVPDRRTTAAPSEAAPALAPIATPTSEPTSEPEPALQGASR